MAIGPVQLLVVGFKHPDFQGEIRAELDRLRDNDLVRVIDSDETAWDVLEEIPPDSAGLLLLEHRWDIPLRDAIARAGGFRLASEFIRPLDLVAIGLVEAEEAEALVSAERDAI